MRIYGRLFTPINFSHCPLITLVLQAAQMGSKQFQKQDKNSLKLSWHQLCYVYLKKTQSFLLYMWVNEWDREQLPVQMQWLLYYRPRSGEIIELVASVRLSVCRVQQRAKRSHYQSKVIVCVSVISRRVRLIAWMRLIGVLIYSDILTRQGTSYQPCSSDFHPSVERHSHKM